MTEWKLDWLVLIIVSSSGLILYVVAYRWVCLNGLILLLRHSLTLRYKPRVNVNLGASGALSAGGLVGTVRNSRGHDHK